MAGFIKLSLQRNILIQTEQWVEVGRAERGMIDGVRGKYLDQEKWNNDVVSELFQMVIQLGQTY